MCENALDHLDMEHAEEKGSESDAESDGEVPAHKFVKLSSALTTDLMLGGHATDPLDTLAQQGKAHLDGEGLAKMAASWATGRSELVPLDYVYQAFAFE